MPVGRTETANGALPSPFPEGWYFLASRKSLEKAKLVRKTWMGEEIVVWCDQRGNVCAAEAYCPHLGSDLGPDAGGRVRDGRLVCPFHGFEYEADGRCVATPYAPAPENMALRVFETRQVEDLIFAWWGIGGRPPRWRLPTEPPDQTGWSDLRIWTHRFAGHPQETTENAVDLAHLRYVHGYDGVGRVETIASDGPRFESNFDFVSTRRIAGVPFIKLRLTAHTDIYGLGYSFVAIREHTIGLDMRLWVLATPVDGTLIDLSIVSQVREIRRPGRWVPGLGFLPVKLRAPLMNRMALYFQRHDVLDDVVIWSRKESRLQPLLCRSDGEIMAYRAYCRQFYPNGLEAVGEPAVGEPAVGEPAVGEPAVGEPAVGVPVVGVPVDQVTVGDDR